MQIKINCEVVKQWPEIIRLGDLKAEKILTIRKKVALLLLKDREVVKSMIDLSDDKLRGILSQEFLGIDYDRIGKWRSDNGLTIKPLLSNTFNFKKHTE